MMKNSIYIFFFLLIICSCESTDFNEYMQEVNNSYDYPPMFSAQNNYIVDLYLVYQGNFHPVGYTEDIFEPYVYTNTNEGFNWLYDGFLFLELRLPNGRQLGSTALKEDWAWLLNRHFGEDIGITALNSVLQKLRWQGHVPSRKRKVVMSIPAPNSSPINWGEIDGRTLDMTNDADRIESVRWFIDETLNKWKENDYDELEFAGFYWLHEGESNYTTDANILPSVADYIKGKGFHFYWIPYFGAAMGSHQWKDWGFDIAYEQPNYFFKDDKDKTVTRLNDACQYASKYNMGMEFECNRLISEELYQTRFNEYIEYFDRHKVWENAPVAYFDDRGTLGEMSKSTDNTLVSLYNKLCDKIIERQKRADEIYNGLK